jgi:hypothetical protein
MTIDMYERAASNASEKFLGGVTTGEKIKVTDFSDAQYFIDVQIGTPG